MIVYANATHSHKVQLKLFGWLLVQISDNERVRLDVRNQLFLLLQYVLEVVQVTFGLVLVHELLNQLLLRELGELLQVSPQFFISEYCLDRLGEDSYCSYCGK